MYRCRVVARPSSAYTFQPRQSVNELNHWVFYHAPARPRVTLARPTYAILYTTREVAGFPANRRTNMTTSNGGSKGKVRVTLPLKCMILLLPFWATHKVNQVLYNLTLYLTAGAYSQTLAERNMG